LFDALAGVIETVNPVTSLLTAEVATLPLKVSVFVVDTTCKIPPVLIALVGKEFALALAKSKLDPDAISTT